MVECFMLHSYIYFHLPTISLLRVSNNKTKKSVITPIILTQAPKKRELPLIGSGKNEKGAVLNVTSGVLLEM